MSTYDMLFCCYGISSVVENAEERREVALYGCGSKHSLSFNIPTVRKSTVLSRSSFS
jgi:hypothetical protein